MAPRKFLAENGHGWNAEDISEFIGDGVTRVSDEHVKNVLTWAELLGIAYHGADGWGTDPGVKQVLLMS